MSSTLLGTAHTQTNKPKPEPETLTPIQTSKTMNPFDSPPDLHPNLQSPHTIPTQHHTLILNTSTQSQLLILNITMMPAPLLPAWNLKDPTAPLKEEYIQLYKDTTTYHHQTNRHLKPLVKLHMQMPPLPLLEIFTNKGAILAHVSNLHMHLGELHYLYSQGQAADASHKSSIVSTAKLTTPCLKSALLITYDGTSSKA